MRKAVAGILIGLGAGAAVLAADLLLTTMAGGVGSNPLQRAELITYDWRLTHTARPETARQDIALVEIDEYSLRNLQKVAGRWPWPRAVHSMLVDYLAAARAKSIAYDIDFAEADTRKGFDFGGSTWSGAESDDALVTSVKAAGNVILLADATFEGTRLDTSTPPIPQTGYPLDVPGIVERRVVFPPFDALAAAGAGLGHNLFILDPDGPIRHTVPFVRSGGRVIPSLGLAAAMRVAGIHPGDVALDGDVLTIGDRVLPLERRRVNGVRRGRLPVGARRFPRTCAARRSEASSVPELLVLRPRVLGGADPRRCEAEHRPVGVPRQDRLCRRHRRRPLRRVRDAVCRREDARHPGARGRRRRPAVESFPARGAGRRARRRGGGGRRGDRRRRDARAGLVGDGRYAGGVRRRSAGSRRALVRRRATG